jgi:2-polyprenyl-3-methyl-5-hydroxy-6-metoxy-1,4-benzoquinol methylase
MYSEDYYKTINYQDYLSRKDRYSRLAAETSQLLTQICLLNKDSRILDYGCAVGFLIEGLKNLGYKNSCGFEISEWASNEARKKGLEVYNEFFNFSWDVMFALDVLEHMTDKQIREVFHFYKTNCLVFRIPVSNDRKTYILPVSNQDPTHVNCKTVSDWEELFKSLGYVKILRLNLYTIYDTPGVFCGLALKS